MLFRTLLIPASWASTEGACAQSSDEKLRVCEESFSEHIVDNSVFKPRMLQKVMPLTGKFNIPAEAKGSDCLIKLSLLVEERTLSGEFADALRSNRC